MKTNSKCQRRIAAVAACLALGWLCWSAQSAGHAQTAPANLSPALLEVVKLAQAHMSDDIITSYIKNSGAAYPLSVDDILYLNSQGVSQNVIAVLQQSKPAAPAYPATPQPPAYPATPAPAYPTTPAPAYPTTPAPAYQTTPAPAYPAMPAPYPATTPAPYVPEAYVPAVAPVGSDITLNYFQDQLRPYGRWVDVPPYGPAWQPTDALVVPGWRPYLNQGYWVNTDSGFYWHSDAPYGDIVFHYGRWLRDVRYGWVWIPGYDWAPAWVSWRHAEGFAGWAPLPPAARFEVGVGLMYRGGLAVDVDFGLAPDDYVFVGYDHFLAHGYQPFLVERERAGLLFRGSLVMNDYRIMDGRVVVEGLGRDRVAAFAHVSVLPVERITIRDARIERGRELEVARTVERVKEIQARPATDPLRRTLETRDAVRPGLPRPADVRGPADVRRPEDARGPTGTGTRGDSGTRGADTGTRGTSTGRDTRGSRDSSGGGPGR
jgi:hypothetical protein